ncbi:GMC oxidoreductase [Heliocybe sulcata]|uniref:GMC oxidoreductase n=1 Tax=Heliocybe sulcata TaxID=5364 RepID=A0A5C3MP35_9AGAM|nr:GMC oxidoreductase [Heliocybe sulcata]
MPPPTCLLHEVANATVDYVICGGGTAGLALAARLTEDPSISVTVLEAGPPNLEDPKILIPGQFGATFSDPKYDWCFSTVPQKDSNDRVFDWPRGKCLGGSSAINFCAWTKPPAQDIDAIEKLGNPGWNWSEYIKYSMKSETFREASEDQMSIYPHTYDKDYRGMSGPIQTTVPHLAHTVDEVFQRTLVNKGVKAIRDPYGGDITGTWIAAATLDRTSWTRSYAATAYYLPNRKRTNLKVLTSATVARLIWRNAPAGETLTATGVDFIYEGQSYSIHVRKEVILSAGAIKSPQILELSGTLNAGAGIGTTPALSRIGVDQKIDLPVGENVQEHVFLGVSYELSPDRYHETLDSLRDPEFAARQRELYKELKGLYRLGITSLSYLPLSFYSPTSADQIIEEVHRRILDYKNAASLPPGRLEQLDVQLNALRDGTVPDVEFIGFPGYFTPITKPETGKNYITVLIVSTHPFSRGTIHASSPDPLEQPEIDPCYLEDDHDLQILAEAVKFVRSLTDIEPWKSGTVREINPGPSCTTDEEIHEYIKSTQASCWHTVGSCSMLPRDKGGVVDPDLKASVYGTSNVRVVDLSIIPLHVASHTYGMCHHQFRIACP